MWLSRHQDIFLQATRSLYLQEHTSEFQVLVPLQIRQQLARIKVGGTEIDSIPTEDHSCNIRLRCQVNDTYYHGNGAYSTAPKSTVYMFSLHFPYCFFLSMVPCDSEQLLNDVQQETYE
jgi:hypothetical protein